MIGWFKNKVKKHVDSRFKLLKNQQRLNEQTHFSYNQISRLFQEENFIPFSIWSISPDTILHVLNDICINRRKQIIEFGAGASTFYIAKLIKVLKIDAVFYSVESDANWIEKLQYQLNVYQLEDYVNIIYAPLRNITAEFRYQDQEIWYDTAILMTALKDVQNIDLILVDGPVGANTPFARYSALPFLKSKLKEDISIYLDDTMRPDEKQIAEIWHEILGGNLKYIGRYAVLVKKSKAYYVTPFQLTDIPL